MVSEMVETIVAKRELGNGRWDRALKRNMTALSVADNYDEAKHEWKVSLESVLLEQRAGFYGEATRCGELAIAQHYTTGRLWATVIQHL